MDSDLDDKSKITNSETCPHFGYLHQINDNKVSGCVDSRIVFLISDILHMLPFQCLTDLRHTRDIVWPCIYLLYNMKVPIHEQRPNVYMLLSSWYHHCVIYAKNAVTCSTRVAGVCKTAVFEIAKSF